MKHHLLPIISGIFLSFGITKSQNLTRIVQNDSLAGFNEQSYRDNAKFKGITMDEMDVYLSISRREFIKSKYNLPDPAPAKIILPEINSAKTSTAACNNEDFEAFGSSYPVPSTVSITTINGIPGWTSTSGNNSGGSTGSCQLTGCCSAAPNVLQVIAPGAAGLIDPIIGASYPIYSVFGNNLNTTATALNGFNCYGDWFVKVNDQVGGAGLTRLTKTLTVSPSNVIFNFAYIAVVQSAHCCCDNGGVSIKFRDCLGNLLASASQFSISPPAGAACTPSGSCTSPSTITVLSAPTVGWYYNKWVNSSIDLSLWMGNCITIEVTGIDCPYAGHGGYAYFDGQCAATVVNNIYSYNSSNEFLLYPNPASNYFTIDVPVDITGIELELKNVLGQSCLKKKLTSGKNIIETDKLSHGMYTYAVLKDETKLKLGKVVIE